MALVLAAAGAAAWLVELSLAGLGERPGPLVRPSCAAASAAWRAASWCSGVPGCCACAR